MWDWKELICLRETLKVRNLVISVIRIHILLQNLNSPQATVRFKSEHEPDQYILIPADLHVSLKLNMDNFHDLNYSQNLSWKSNWKAKFIRQDIFPVANTMKEWHAYLSESCLLLIITFAVSLVLKFFTHKDFAFYLCGVKKACAHDRYPRKSWQ